MKATWVIASNKFGLIVFHKGGHQVNFGVKNGMDA
jgi:hypothetical protein